MITSRLWLFISLLVVSSYSCTPKSLGGPAGEFSLHDLPDPSHIKITDRTYSIPIWFDTPNQDNLVYVADLPIDSPTDFIFVFSSPHAEKILLELFDPNGSPVDLSNKEESYFKVGSSYELPGTIYHVKNEVVGKYKLNMKTDMESSVVDVLRKSIFPNAALSLINNAEIQIETQYTTFVIKAGKPFGLISTLVDITSNMNTSTISNIEIISAELDVITPDGSELYIPMTDDADCLGASKQMGLYAAEIPSPVAGSYHLQAVIRGTYQETALNTRVEFARTSEHFIKVSAATVELSGTAVLRPKDEETVYIDIGVNNIATSQPKLRAYAQVWGVDPNTKQQTAAAWIGGVVSINDQSVTLELNLNWLKLAGVTGPLTLKEVYLADITLSLPVSSFEGNIEVENSAIELELKEEMKTMNITKRMRYGQLPPNVYSNASQTPYLVLLGGYCSDNPWVEVSQYFTEPTAYPSENGNFGHDEYACKVINMTKSLGPFSMIGHSQGGQVATHILNYYSSGLDYVVSDNPSYGSSRVVQTLGSPYQGCSVAGIVAVIAQIFGINCGANFDLTVIGSQLWLLGISTQTRQQVSYYTTTFYQKKLLDYCSTMTHLFEKQPSDGLAELVYTFLPSAHYQGNKEGWCHSTGYKYTAQFLDSDRNKEMNIYASRRIQ